MADIKFLTANTKIQNTEKEIDIDKEWDSLEPIFVNNKNIYFLKEFIIVTIRRKSDGNLQVLLGVDIPKQQIGMVIPMVLNYNMLRNNDVEVIKGYGYFRVRYYTKELYDLIDKNQEKYATIVVKVQNSDLLTLNLGNKIMYNDKLYPMDLIKESIIETERGNILIFN
jgi:hypothetical protein